MFAGAYREDAVNLTHATPVGSAWSAGATVSIGTYLYTSNNKLYRYTQAGQTGTTEPTATTGTITDGTATAVYENSIVGTLALTKNQKITLDGIGNVFISYDGNNINFSGPANLVNGGTSVTPSANDSSAQIATTQWVANAITNIGVIVKTSTYSSSLGTHVALSETSSQNTYVGYIAGHFNTTGSYNTAVGSASQESTTTGNNNTSLGQTSLQFNTIGSNNVALGVSAAIGITDAETSIFIGAGSAQTTVSGDKTTTTSFASIIGADAHPLADNDTNETIIGYSANGHGSNTTTIGNANVTKTYINGGIVIEALSNTAITSFSSPEDGMLVNNSTNFFPEIYENGVWYPVHLDKTYTFSTLPASSLDGTKVYCSDCYSKLREQNDSVTGIDVIWHAADSSWRDALGLLVQH